MSSLIQAQPTSSAFELVKSRTTTRDSCADTQYPRTGNLHGNANNNWFSTGLPTPPRTREMTGITVSHGGHGSYTNGQTFPNSYTNGQPSSKHTRVPSDLYATSRRHSRTNSTSDPTTFNITQADEIAPHLQIPESISKSKGNLPEFAAEITCLFWFEDAATLQYAAELATDTPSDRGLVADAVPSIGFRKWVTTILSTTQVGTNVILLALMFIYRLKKFNPSVSGKRGSEFRLLTIALMLGNKFLDDNTYTNKTWAEVSGISVKEIHVMEVEFLSNMRYELYASKSDWLRWKMLLGRFGEFYEKASRFRQPVETNINTVPNPPITPTAQTFNYKLPSPPSHHHNTNIVQPNYSSLPNPLATLPQLPPSPIRLHQTQTASFDRKRSLDVSDSIPSAKRVQYLPPNTSSQASVIHNQRPMVPENLDGGNAGLFNGSYVPHLPVPRISSVAAGAEGHITPSLLPSNRAMASVYPPVSTAWQQPITPTSTILASTNGGFGMSSTPDLSRAAPGLGSARTSPVSLLGPSTPTRPGLSPSYFLTNRSSPYRPVRHVNTLLIPPPSAAMQSTMKNVGYDQMQYLPLGRPMTERRTGPVPFMYPDGRTMSNVSTPNTLQQYRSS